ncbi:hypothetical protein PFISCL1PPCAC_25660, partial [Pristionchus fissidentatus]
TVHSNLQLILFVLHLCIVAIFTHFRFYSNASSAMVAVVSMYFTSTLLALVNFILFSIRKTRNAIPPVVVLVIMATLFILDLVNIIVMYSATIDLGAKQKQNSTKAGDEYHPTDKNLVAVRIAD